MQSKDTDELIISKDETIINCLNKMDKLDRKLLIIMNNKIFEGLISSGDIQRAIIKGLDLDECVEKIKRKKIRVGNENQSVQSIKKQMIEHRMEYCPILTQTGELSKIIFWDEVFDETITPLSKFSLPVVIMAGGIGSRMKPLTNIIPKPMIPIGDRSIIETIIDKFEIHGCEDFHISVNYKSEILEYFLNNLELKCELQYYKERKRLGTAGGLSLMKDNLKETFFVVNCDIIIEDDYSNILEYHKKNKNDITIVSVLKTISIPYGTLKTKENGVLEELTEKPSMNFQINSGMYILEPMVIEKIPKDKFYDITELIQKVVDDKGKVGVFPTTEKSWIDIGNWTQYYKVINE